jgi:hypothetical protein
MFKTTRDLLQYIGLSLFGLAAMLLLIHMLGELHGLIVTVIILVGESSLLLTRVGALQRELIILRQERGVADAKAARQA